MTNLAKKLLNKSLRKARVRSTVHGTAERPRLSVTISNLHVSAQLIDDDKRVTVAAATTVGKKATGTMTEKEATGTMTEKAAGIGTDIAKKAAKAKVKAVVFDRNGRAYAGRLKALAALHVKKDWSSSMAEQTADTTPQAAAPAAAPAQGNRQGGRGQARGGRRDDRRNQAPQEPKQFEEVVINIDRVARVVKGGRRFRKRWSTIPFQGSRCSR